MVIKGTIAFFISPTGDIFHVPINHIATILGDPEIFGLTKEEIQTVYERHGEKIGVEGEARREILLKVIVDGWVRLRRYPNRYWSIVAPSLTPAVHKHLRDWAMRILAGIEGFKEPDRYMPVKIDTSEGQIYSKIGELADGSCPL